MRAAIHILLLQNTPQRQSPQRQLPLRGVFYALRLLLLYKLNLVDEGKVLIYSVEDIDDSYY